MTRLFTTTFDEELKSRGFKRKAKLYYRLNGEILQGIIIKTINPYTLHFTAIPYWMERRREYTTAYSKGFWAENGICISPGTDAYYRAENEQLNLDYMNICFELAKKYALPALDKIKDIDSYMEYCLPHWDLPDKEASRKRVLKIHPCDIDAKYSYIRFPITLLWDAFDSLYTHYAFLNYAYSIADIQKGYEMLKDTELRREHGGDFSLKQYREFLGDDGMEKAEKYFSERKAKTLPLLRDELGLNTFHLK